MAKHIQVLLKNVDTQEDVVASLIEPISESHIDQYENQWKSLGSVDTQEHSHWDWRAKIRHFTNRRDVRGISIVTGDQLQGLMLDSLGKYSTATNRKLVYIDFLETAPWNIVRIPSRQQFRRVGTILVIRAAQISTELGYDGIIGLHSLPQSEAYYRKLGMKEFGNRFRKEGLTYFESTDESFKS